MDPIQAGLATLFASGTLTGLSDVELLERWASRGDRTAFEVLVRRHGRLVMNVCHRLLADPSDADDAFQATFLVLGRKAGSIRTGDALASWLCRVAYRIAVRAGVDSKRCRQAERRAADRSNAPSASGAADRTGTDEIAILFHEIDRLPERYRIVIVLCHLEGLSTEAAARQLGCPVGTIWARLSRAAALLRSRLVRRGVSLSVPALSAGGITPMAEAAISSKLLLTTIRSSLGYPRPMHWASQLPRPGLSRGRRLLLRAMLHAKLKAAAMIALAVGALVTVGAVLAQGHRQAAQPTNRVAEPEQVIRRTIHFPDDRAIGIIYLLDTDEHDLSAIRDYDRWQRIGEARGVVRLPARGLVRLDLARSAVADLSPLQQLDTQAIQVLRLRNLGAHDDALRHVSHWKGLLRLDLQGNFFTGQALEDIVLMHGLLSLDLGDTTIGDDGIRQIAPLKSLRQIDLKRSRITDRSLELLGSMSRLESLDLYQTAITDRGVAHIVGLKNLRNLRISHTNTTNVSLEHVAKLENLDHFDFGETRVTDSGLAYLGGLMKLKSIRADQNRFTDAGLAHLARLPALEELSVGGGTSFTDRGLAHLGRCRSLRILHLQGHEHFSDDGLARLAQLPLLKELTISGRASREPGSAPAITDRGMESLGRIKTLKQLALNDVRIGGDGLDSLSRLPALETLQLQKTTLTFEDLRHLDGFDNLKHFLLSSVPENAGRPTLRAFRSLTSLESLRLPDKADARRPDDTLDFEPVEFANLSGLTKLKSLNYSGRLTDAGLKHLAPLTAMVSLDFPNADITDDGLRYLSGMTNLDNVTIGGRITDEGLRHLVTLQSLRVLQLRTRTVSLEGVKWLWERLPSLQMVPGFDDQHPLIVGPRIVYTKVGEKAPDFSVITRDGKLFRLADHRGKVVLLHFWGPKCAPCIRAMPKLKQLHQELAERPDRFAMISFTAGMEDRDWRAFLGGHGMDWPQALLTGGDLKVWADFHVRGIPDYAVIDPSGKIVADGDSTGGDVTKLMAKTIRTMEN